MWMGGGGALRIPVGPIGLTRPSSLPPLSPLAVVVGCVVVTALVCLPSQSLFISTGSRDNAMYQWNIDAVDGVPKLVRSRVGHSAPPTRYDAGGGLRGGGVEGAGCVGGGKGSLLPCAGVCVCLEFVHVVVLWGHCALGTLSGTWQGPRPWVGDGVCVDVV